MTSRNTILFVIGDLDIGGTEKHLTRIVCFLAHNGFQPLVYTLTHKGRLAHQVIGEGIEIRAPPLADWIRLLPRSVRPLVSLPMTTITLFWLMYRRRPDIVHFFLPASYVIGGLCSLIVGPRIRVMSRRSLNDYQHDHPFLTRLEPWLHRRMTAVIGNSRAVVAQLADEGVPADRLGLIYNGVDLESFNAVKLRTGVRADLRIDNDVVVLISIANLIAYKGHTDLLEGLAAVANKLGKRWVLLCIGRDTGIGKSLRQLTRMRGLEGNVRWLGERQDVSDILNASDIGMLCSHQEGFSNSVLEAMAAGVPMVVTDVGGNKEAVIDGETGLVVPPKNPKALGSAILKLVRDPSLRTQMGAAARERAREVFPISRCAMSYACLYRGLLERKAYSVEELLQRPS